MAQHALVAAAFASCFGSIVGNLVLAGAAEPLAQMSLKFGPAEYFWLGIFGLTIISVLSSGSLLKGFVTATLGLLLSSVGMATLSGEVRLTFGFPELQGGIGLAGALIGFFCLPEILSNFIGKRQNTYTGVQVRPSLSVISETVRDLILRPVLMLRSSLIGLVVGIAPGAGGNIASMVSYSEATRWEKNPEEFGKGTTRGVAASEAANSAMAPGSLIPLLTLGIPGSPPAAVILGALMLHGMQPGNDLFVVYSDITYAFIVGLLVASIAVLILGTAGSFIYARIINVPSRTLAPLILLMTVLGSYAIRNNLLDVWVMLVFGIVGLILNRLRFQPAPLVLGIILGPYIENGLVQSMMIGGASGSVLSYMTLRPISLFLIALCLLSAFGPWLLSLRTRKQSTSIKSDNKITNVTGVNSDLIMGVVCLLVAAVVIFSTRELSLHGGVFIRFSTGLLIVLGITSLIIGIRNPDKVPFFESTAERARICTGILMLVSYLVLMPIVGFVFASLIFYIIMSLTLKDTPWSGNSIMVILAQALLFVGVLYSLFYYLLQVPLPTGLFQ